MTPPVNVLVFPTRNEPGLETVQALAKSNKIRLFGGSSYESRFDPARHFLEHYILCPGCDEPDFEPRFKEIIRKHDIHVVFPMWDPLVAIFSRWNVPGTVFITPDAETAQLLLSKRATYERLSGIVPVPRLFDPEDAAPPLFAKPDRDSGSRNTMHVTNQLQLNSAVEQGLLLCEYLPGREFTVDCVSNMDGALLFANVRERSRIGRGIALGTEAIAEPAIQRHVRRIAAELRIRGPWFAQFRENTAGSPVLMEINARIAGSMTLTRFCGVNIPLISVFLFTGEQVKIPRMRPVLINRCLRTFADETPFESVIWDWDDTVIRKDGKPDPDVVACLYDLHNRGVRLFLLSKNAEAANLMLRHQVPDFFIEKRFAEDKVAALAELMASHKIDPRACALVNDSYAETFLVQERFPDLRTITPDAIEVLGRERL
ncbi:MAG: ATP-grasp domain-containing protein [Candidatus Hydrogenedentes bacterium]|nr:ATP-grasp domain-containing protein [Candidatus Hydrogenedentota bacterium]